jgi:hypothetical protein
MLLRKKRFERQTDVERGYTPQCNTDIDRLMAAFKQLELSTRFRLNPYTEFVIEAIISTETRRQH